MANSWSLVSYNLFIYCVTLATLARMSGWFNASYRLFLIIKNWLFLDFFCSYARRWCMPYHIAISCTWSIVIWSRRMLSFLKSWAWSSWPISVSPTSTIPGKSWKRRVDLWLIQHPKFSWVTAMMHQLLTFGRLASFSTCSSADIRPSRYLPLSISRQFPQNLMLYFHFAGGQRQRNINYDHGLQVYRAAARFWRMSPSHRPDAAARSRSAG